LSINKKGKEVLVNKGKEIVAKKTVGNSRVLLRTLEIFQNLAPTEPLTTVDRLAQEDPVGNIGGLGKEPKEREWREGKNHITVVSILLSWKPAQSKKSKRGDSHMISVFTVAMMANMT
jgi:hypothetical protein